VCGGVVFSAIILCVEAVITGLILCVWWGKFTVL